MPLFFAGDYAATLAILAGSAAIIAQEKEHLVDGEIMLRYRRIRNVRSILAGVVILSMAIPWDWMVVGIHVRLIICYAPIISFWTNRMLTRRFGSGRTQPSGIS